MSNTIEKNPTVVKKEKNSFLPKLRELSAKLTAYETEMDLFWTTNQAMLLAAKNNVVTRANNSWNTNLGYADEELIGTCLPSMAHDDDREKLLNAIELTKAGDPPPPIVIKVKHSNKDSWIYVRMSLSYAADADILFITSWPLLNKCKDCPFLKNHGF